VRAPAALATCAGLRAHRRGRSGPGRRRGARFGSGAARAARLLARGRGSASARGARVRTSVRGTGAGPCRGCRACRHACSRGGAGAGARGRSARPGARAGRTRLRFAGRCGRACAWRRSAWPRAGARRSRRPRRRRTCGGARGQHGVQRAAQGRAHQRVVQRGPQRAPAVLLHGQQQHAVVRRAPALPHAGLALGRRRARWPRPAVMRAPSRRGAEGARPGTRLTSGMRPHMLVRRVCGDVATIGLSRRASCAPGAQRHASPWAGRACTSGRPGPRSRPGSAASGSRLSSTALSCTTLMDATRSASCARGRVSRAGSAAGASSLMARCTSQPVLACRRRACRAECTAAARLQCRGHRQSLSKALIAAPSKQTRAHPARALAGRPRRRGRRLGAGGAPWRAATRGT